MIFNHIINSFKNYAMKRTALYFWLLMASQIICGPMAYSQSTDASSTGTVINIAKKALAGATVTIINKSNGFKATTKSNAKGIYLFNQ